MHVKENLRLKRSEDHQIYFDIRIPDAPCALVFFMHGFKGFKDWGHFNYCAERFAASGIAFVKFNFSRNGMGEHPGDDFTELELFSQNTFSQELKDLNDIETHVLKLFPELQHIPFGYIGHSRAAGIGLIAAKKGKASFVISWAGVSDYWSWLSKFDLEMWKSEGELKLLNTRTKQLMPMKYAIVEDFLDKRETFSIQKACEQLECPLLICHGMSDEAVAFEEAQSLFDWSANAELILVENAGHTFNVSHPFDGRIPEEAELVIDQSIVFVKSVVRA